MGAVIGRYVTGIVVEKLWETGQGCFDCGHRLAAVPSAQHDRVASGLRLVTPHPCHAEAGSLRLITPRPCHAERRRSVRRTGL